MPIELHQGGGFLATGDGITLYRLGWMVRGLKMEVRSNGEMRLTRGLSCYALAKKEFGFKGNRVKVLEQLEKVYQERSNKVDRVDEDGYLICCLAPAADGHLPGCQHG